MRSNAPTTARPAPQALQPHAAGGRITTTPNGIAHAAPGGNGTAAPGIVPELLTSKQAAELLAIGERSLWRWSRSGICPAPIKIGGGPRAAVRYRRAELAAWVAAGCPRCDDHGGQRR